MNTIHDAFIAFIIVINKNHFLITFIRAVTRFDIPLAQNMLIIRGICGCWVSTVMTVTLWCVLFCHGWFEEEWSLFPGADRASAGLKPMGAPKGTHEIYTLLLLVVGCPAWKRTF